MLEYQEVRGGSPLKVATTWDREWPIEIREGAGRPKVVSRNDRAVELRQAGRSWREIANELGVGVTTVRRAVEVQTRLDV